MTSAVEWISVLIINYPLLQYVIVFLGAAFGGEVALFALGFLAAQGILHVFPLFLFSFLGTLSSDTLWFLLGKTTFMKRMISHRYAHTTISIIAKAIDHVSRGSRFIALILAKFLAGTRILMIMYVSKNNLELKKFIQYDAIAIILWLVVVIPIGFIAGLGFTYLSDVLKSIYAGVGFLLLFILLIFVIQVWLKKFFLKEEEDIFKKDTF